VTTIKGDGDRDVLCAFVGDIDDAASAADTPGEELNVLRRFQPRFEEAIAAAPKAMLDYVRTMTAASQQAIEEGKPSAASSDAVVDAGYQLDNYCGIGTSAKG
jgi:hypothetical protein